MLFVKYVQYSPQTILNFCTIILIFAPTETLGTRPSLLFIIDSPLNHSSYHALKHTPETQALKKSAKVDKIRQK